MKTTGFEKWCAGELGCSPEAIMKERVNMPNGRTPYMSNNISRMYRAYMAGIISVLPQQVIPTNEEDL